MTKGAMISTPSLNAAPEKLKKFISKGKVSATLAMNMIAEKRTDELMGKIESGESVGEGEPDAITPAVKPKKVTAKALAPKVKANPLQSAIAAIKALTKEDDIDNPCIADYNQAICDVLDILEAN